MSFFLQNLCQELHVSPAPRAGFRQYLEDALMLPEAQVSPVCPDPHEFDTTRVFCRPQGLPQAGKAGKNVKRLFETDSKAVAPARTGMRQILDKGVCRMHSPQFDIVRICLRDPERSPCLPAKAGVQGQKFSVTQPGKFPAGSGTLA